MEFIVNREVTLINERILIDFAFKAKFLDDLRGYKRLDVHTTPLRVESICAITPKQINTLNSIYPIHHSFAMLCFFVMPDLTRMFFYNDSHNCKSNFDRKAFGKIAKRVTPIFYEIRKEYQQRYAEENEKRFG